MLYSDSDVIESKNALKRHMTVAIALLAAGIVVTVAGLIVRNKALAVAGVIAGAALAYFWYDMKALPWRKYHGFLCDMSTGRAHVSEGVVTLVKDGVRKSEEGVEIRDFYLKESPDGAETLFYWDEAKTLPDVVGKSVRVNAYGRYVIEISVI